MSTQLIFRTNNNTLALCSRYSRDHRTDYMEIALYSSAAECSAVMDVVLSRAGTRATHFCSVVSRISRISPVTAVWGKAGPYFMLCDGKVSLSASLISPNFLVGKMSKDAANTTWRLLLVTDEEEQWLSEYRPLQSSTRAVTHDVYIECHLMSLNEVSLLLMIQTKQVYQDARARRQLQLQKSIYTVVPEVCTHSQYNRHTAAPRHLPKRKVRPNSIFLWSHAIVSRSKKSRMKRNQVTQALAKCRRRGARAGCSCPAKSARRSVPWSCYTGVRTDNADPDALILSWPATSPSSTSTPTSTPTPTSPLAVWGPARADLK